MDWTARALDQLSRRERFTEASDYVFVGDKGQPLDDDKIRKRFYAALTRAGLDHKRKVALPRSGPYLRHTSL